MLLDDISAYLIAQGAVPPPWRIFEGYFPDSDPQIGITDQVIGLFETGGYPADSLGRENERVTFQTRIRAARLDYATGRAQWQLVFNTLQDAQYTAGSPQLLPGVWFIQALHQGPLHFNDDLGRPNFTCNWRVYRRRS
jgi:hypothetical protein